EREVDAPLDERFAGAPRDLGNDLDVDAREAAMKRTEERREPGVAGVAGRAHADHAVLVIRQAANVFFRRADLREHALGGGEEALAGRRQRQTAVDAQEQRRAEAVLDLAQLMAE